MLSDSTPFIQAMAIFNIGVTSLVTMRSYIIDKSDLFNTFSKEKFEDRKEFIEIKLGVFTDSNKINTKIKEAENSFSQYSQLLKNNIENSSQSQDKLVPIFFISGVFGFLILFLVGIKKYAFPNVYGQIELILAIQTFLIFIFSIWITLASSVIDQVKKKMIQALIIVFILSILLINYMDPTNFQNIKDIGKHLDFVIICTLIFPIVFFYLSFYLKTLYWSIKYANKLKVLEGAFRVFTKGQDSNLDSTIILPPIDKLKV